MILPTLIVGNKLLILGGIPQTIGAWFAAHRPSYQSDASDPEP